MERMIFELSRRTEAYIANGALGGLGELAAPIIRGRRAALVYDGKLPPKTVREAVSSLKGAGFRVFSRALKGSETDKDLATVNDIYGFLYDSGITRSDVLIALGGGVTGDVSGFAAATYLRGIGLALAPTTIVSQTDSAYGGKTGVDFRAGKNHIGCFYPADLVVTDPLLLSSLPEEERVSGMGEVIKYGAIAAPSILDGVSRDLPTEATVAACVGIKKSFVELDELDEGPRRVLNFGHTFGHAIEEASGYEIPHGQAVAYGMLISSKLGEKLGLTDPSVFPAIMTACEKAGLNNDFEAFVPSAIPYLTRDKKFDGGSIAFVIIKSLGEPGLVRLNIEDIKATLL